jgi:[ribosomal protein S18]-alanine N-acetyltransferase
MIRKFKIEDKEKVIELLRLNTPRFFDLSEEDDLQEYLVNESENYYVFEENNKVIGVGGINYGFDGGTTARISWDIIHPTNQGKGIGSKLTEFRIEEIKKKDSVKKIIVRTSQLVYEFYSKFGFEIDLVEKDFWAKDIDLYQMKIDIKKI